MEDEVEQGDGRERRPRQRQHHVPEDLERVGAVELGRLQQFLGDFLEEADEDDQVPGVDRLEEDHRPVAVEQAQPLHEEIVGNDAGIEDDRDQHQDEDERRPGRPGRDRPQAISAVPTMSMHVPAR